jgi:hypothetical protein
MTAFGIASFLAAAAIAQRCIITGSWIRVCSVCWVLRFVVVTALAVVWAFE